MPAIARLGDVSDHGGAVVSCSDKMTADGIGVARHGDLHECPIPGHGVTAFTSTCLMRIDGGRGLVRVGIDSAGCGATVTYGSPTLSVT